MRVAQVEVPSGVLGALAKQRMLRSIITREGDRPNVRSLAFRILNRAGVRSRDWRGYSKALQQWTQARLLYAREPHEQFWSVRRILEAGGADCDDQVILMGALHRSICLPYRTVILLWGEGGHVYGESGDHPTKPRRWTPVETIRRVPYGWSPIAHLRRARRRKRARGAILTTAQVLRESSERTSSKRRPS